MRAREASSKCPLVDASRGPEGPGRAGGSSPAANGAYLYPIPRVSPGLATSHAYVNPLVALALGGLVLGEALSTGAAAALLLTLPAVWLLAR